MYAMPTTTRFIQPIGAASTATVAVISTLLVGTGSIYDLRRTETWRHHIQARVPFVVDAASDPHQDARRPDVRTAAEHIENIRNVLNPAVSDLATLFDVSRQAIYKWLAGTSTPEPEKLDRIGALSQVADAFRNAGVSRAGSLLKMKAFEGKSLLDLFKSGENRPEHIVALIDEAKLMEASYRQSGLASSKAKPTSDWQSYFSIPGAPEQS